MTITPDTNLLVRVVVLDDPAQTECAKAELAQATQVFVTLPALCEFCWVLRSRYRFSNADIVAAVLAISGAENVVVDIDAVDVGIDLLRAGGDFADAVIAGLGHRQGSRAFVSFDRTAVKLISASGIFARQPT